jgi:hypothetical protein
MDFEDLLDHSFDQIEIFPYYISEYTSKDSMILIHSIFENYSKLFESNVYIAKINILGSQLRNSVIFLK